MCGTSEENRGTRPQCMPLSTEGGGPVVAKLITAVSIVLCIIGILYITNVFEFFGLYMTIVPYCGLILMLVLVLAFLIYPAGKGTSTRRLPWYDIMLILMSVASSGYIAFFPGRWGYFLQTGTATMVEVVLCFMLILVILEATRRLVNLAMAVIALFFVIHVLVGPHLPGILLTFPFSLRRIATMFYMSEGGIFGLPVNVASTIIVAFTLFAAFLEKSDAGKFILDATFAATGRWVGGPAKAAIVSSCALGTMCGQTAANVATTGSVTIPLMKKMGYTPEFAGAVECVASNGGQIMPPVMGLIAFLMAELLGVSYWSICVAAFLPAFLYYIGLFVQVHFEAVKLGLKGLPGEQLPSLKRVMRQGWFYLIPLFILIYLLAVLHLPVQHCGLYAALSVVVVSMVDCQRKKKTRKGAKEVLAWFVDSLETGARALLVPAVACAAAGIIIGSLGVTGLGFRLSGILVNIAGGNMLLLLILSAAASYILGMGMSSVPCYLILVVLVAPALVQMGVAPIAAHLFLFYFGIVSFITPPVAVAAYVASGISGGDPFKTGFIAMRLAIVTYIVPFLFVYSPSLLLIGSVGEIMLAMVTAIVGVSLLGIGFERFLLTKLNWVEAALLVVSGLLLMKPGIMTDIIGAAIAVPLLLRHMKFGHRLPNKRHVTTT
jgi:TRAP transporter 4TM/12TM fusion protein